MAFIYKPQTRKGPVFLAPTQGSAAPQIRLSDGRVITAKRGDQAGGVFYGHEGYQYVFPQDVLNQKDATLIFDGQEQALTNSNMSYRGDRFGELSESEKGAIGYADPGAAGRFAPGMAGEYGFYPAYLGENFPTASTIRRRDIKSAPYNFIDPQAFAQGFGEYSRGEYAKNFELAKKFSLETLDTELQALRQYAPAAAALKRQETALDNVFNQQQRMEQVRSALPGVERQLSAQASRAEAYAQGRLPDEMQDRALELGIRSQAADRATTAGFGATSAVSRKASDLMSAQQRLQLGQYGEQLLSGNIASKANLYMAPTQYSDAGSQIKVTPTVSPAQLTAQQLSDINQYSMITPSTALQSVMQQEQFRTNLEDSVRKFNSQMNFNMKQFNASAQNQFKMAAFNYDVSYAGAVAGAYQTNLNTQEAFRQQQEAREEAVKQRDKTQRGNAISSGIAAIGAVAGAVIGAGIFSGGTSGASAGDVVDESGGVLQEDGSVKYPDGSSISTDGSITDQSGNVVGRFEQNEDGSETFIPSPSYEPIVEDSGIEEPEYTPVGYVPPEGDVVAPPEWSPDEPAAEMPYESGSPEAREDFTYSAKASPALAQNITNATARSFISDASLPPQAANTLAALNPTTVDNIANGTLANAGVSYSKLPGYEEVGTDYQGKTVYMDSKLRQDSTYTPGVETVTQLKGLLEPFQIKELSSVQFDQAAKLASDEKTINELNSYAQRGDIKNFVNTVQGSLNKPTTDDIRNQQDIKTAMSAYKLAQNWDRMSNAQKSLGLASVAIQSIRSLSGKDLSKVPIEMTRTDGVAPLTVGGVLNIAGMGLNVYEVAANWGDLSNAQKIVGGVRTAANIAQMGVEAGLISKAGTAAQSVPYLNLAASAINVANGWSKANTEGRAVMAASLASAGAYAAGYTIPGLNIALAAYQGAKLAETGFKDYFEGGTARQKVGYTVGVALGGAATLGAISTIHSLSKSGKSQDQKARDWVRSDWQKRGLADDNYKIQLADGSKVDIGIDGRGGMHAAKDASKLVGEKPETNLRAYDTDYTNDLDYASGMTGVTLQRLLYGGRDSIIDKMGAQLGNAFLGTVGYGKDMTEQNFKTVAANARGFYSRAGIKTKEDGLKLVALAAKQGRLTAADQAAAMQTLDMLYDPDGYQKASSLMQGRWTGINNLKNTPERTPTINTSASPKVTVNSPGKKFGGGFLRASKQEIQERNKQRYVSGMAA